MPRASPDTIVTPRDANSRARDSATFCPYAEQRREPTIPTQGASRHSAQRPRTYNVTGGSGISRSKAGYAPSSNTSTSAPSISRTRSSSRAASAKRSRNEIDSTASGRSLRRSSSERRAPNTPSAEPNLSSRRAAARGPTPGVMFKAIHSFIGSVPALSSQLSAFRGRTHCELDAEAELWRDSIAESRVLSPDSFYGGGGWEWTT